MSSDSIMPGQGSANGFSPPPSAPPVPPALTMYWLMDASSPAKHKQFLRDFGADIRVPQIDRVTDSVYAVC
jgi:hypothetical protein